MKFFTSVLIIGVCCSMVDLQRYSDARTRSPRTTPYYPVVTRETTSFSNTRGITTFPRKNNYLALRRRIKYLEKLLKNYRRLYNMRTFRNYRSLSVILRRMIPDTLQMVQGIWRESGCADRRYSRYCRRLIRQEQDINRIRRILKIRTGNDRRRDDDGRKKDCGRKKYGGRRGNYGRREDDGKRDDDGRRKYGGRRRNYGRTDSSKRKENDGDKKEDDERRSLSKEDGGNYGRPGNYGRTKNYG